MPTAPKLPVGRVVRQMYWPPEMYKELQRLATAKGLNIMVLVRTAVSEWLVRQRPPEAS